MNLGYTQLSIFHDCPRKFHFGQYLQYQPYDTPSAMETGIFVHSAISAALLIGSNYSSAINEEMNNSLRKLQKIQDKSLRIKMESQTCDNAQRAMKLADRYINSYLKDYQPIEIDATVSYKWVTCHPDLICNYKGKRTIVDFKTSRSPDCRWYIHSGQADLYAYIYNATVSTYKHIELTIYDVISEDGIFRLEHLPNLDKAESIALEIDVLANNYSQPNFKLTDSPAHWHYDCPSRCAYFQPCVMLEETNPEGCLELLEKNYEKRYFKNNE
jgi:hypothetical protein